MDKYIGAGIAVLLSMAVAKADIIMNPNDQHTQVGATNPKDPDVQYKHKHQRVADIDDDIDITREVDHDIKKVFDTGIPTTDVWVDDPHTQWIDDRRSDPLDVAEPRSAALLIGMLAGFFLIGRWLPLKLSV